MTRTWSVLLAACLASGCGGGGAPDGEACSSNQDCASALCLDYGDGYCSTDCSASGCADGEVCRLIQGNSNCFVGCGDPGACRAGFQCFRGGCIPACSGDAECGKGFGCANGQCTPLPGAKIGERCASDPDCSSRACDPNTRTCQLSCDKEADCASGQTCYINPIDQNNDSASDAIFPICVARRGGAPPGSMCNLDHDCDLGQCELGVCVVLCEASGNCPTVPPMSCVDMVAQTDQSAPKMRGCLLRRGTITWDLGRLGSGPVGIPSNAVGFNIYVEEQGQDTSSFAGIDGLSDPAGNQIYKAVQTTSEYLALPIRYQPSEGTSMVLVSNAPARATVMAGIYSFGTFAVIGTNTPAPYSARVRIKVGEGAPASGKIPLHVFVTNLSGGICAGFDAASAPNRLAGFEQRLKQIFAGANLDVGPITYSDSAGTSVITVPSQGVAPELDALLKAATFGDQADVLEMVIIKHISSGSSQFEILGISGGVPGSTGISGTVHSGVVVSMTPYCIDGSGQQMAITSAHELGHSLGLFHNVEQDGTTDAITDDDADGDNNLMYWLENSATQLHLSPQQAQVLLANPAVQ